MSRGRPFEPGNTFGRGRPKGSKNKETSPGRRLLEEHEEVLLRKIMAEALKGDMKALLWCSSELMRPKPRAPKLRLTSLKTHDDLARNFDLVLKAMARQKITVADGQAMCALFAEKAKMIEAQKLPTLEELEEFAKKERSK
jgi:hypothetical protein